MGWEGNDRTDRNERRDLWWAECQGVTSESVLVGEKKYLGAGGGCAGGDRARRGGGRERARVWRGRGGEGSVRRARWTRWFWEEGARRKHRRPATTDADDRARGGAPVAGSDLRSGRGSGRGAEGEWRARGPGGRCLCPRVSSCGSWAYESSHRLAPAVWHPESRDARGDIRTRLALFSVATIFPRLLPARPGKLLPISSAREFPT